MRRLMLVLMALATLTYSTAEAQHNDTARQWDALRTEPCVDELNPTCGILVGQLLNAGYTVNDRSFASPSIAEYFADLKTPYGWWIQNSHADARSFTIGLYPNDIARDDTLWSYQNTEYGQYLESTYTPSGLATISVSKEGIKKFFTSPGSVVFNGGCYASMFNSVWTGARVALGYDYQVTATTVFSDVNQLAYSMIGNNGLSKRVLSQAIAGTNLKSLGNTNTVFNPTVVMTSPTPGTSINRSMTFVVRFDCPVQYYGSLPSLVYGVGGVAIDNVQQADQYTISGDIGPWYRGSGTVVIKTIIPEIMQLYGFFGSTGGVGIDADGQQGPSDLWLPYYSSVDNPAASLSTFTAVRQDGGASVRWRVESQSGTDRYLLYRSSTTLGPWSYVNSLPADSLRWDYAIFDPGLINAIYELREVEQQGDTLVLGQAELRDPFLIPFDSMPTVGLADSISQTYWSGHGQHVLQPESILPIYDITYVLPVDPTGAWNNAIQPLVADRLSRGFLVNTITMDQVGNTREGLHNYIKQAYRYGLRGVTLCGSDEDSRSWNKYPWINGWVQPSWVGHPEWALIPMWDWPDPIGVQLQSVSWYRPGMTSDMPYGDVTGDSIPEIPVTRLPGFTPPGLSVAVAKILAYERQDLSTGSYIVADQGRSLSGSSGSWASAMADTFAAMIPSSLQKIRLHDTDALPLTHAHALGQFLTACATNRVVGATFTGTVFNRNKFHWLNRTDGDSWSSLGNGQFLSAIAAPTCELAGTDRRVDPSFGPGLPAMSFNSFPNQGPAWIWASNNGSHQGANSDLGKSFFRYAYQVGCWSAAEAARAAVYDAAQHWYQKYQALGTEILGDVCSPFPGQILRTTSVSNERSADYTLRIARTINHSSIICQWSSPVGQTVRFHLYDLSGRSRMTPTVALGTGSTLETALSTERLSPGMYFLRLQAGNQALSAKCIILR